MDFEWEDPPDPASTARKSFRGKGYWLDLCLRLKNRPGKWARLAILKDTGLARSTTSRLYKSQPKGLYGKFEFVSRVMSDSRVAIYGRYLGED